MFRKSDSHFLSNIQTGSKDYFKMPNGTRVLSKSFGYFQISKSSIQPIKAYIFDDDLLDCSLIGLADICNNTGLSIALTQLSCNISEDGNLIVSSLKNKFQKLWSIELSDFIEQNSDNFSANLSIRHDLNADYVQFVHACFFSPAVSTFTDAIRKGWLYNLPRITSYMVSKNPPQSISTSMGHLNQLRQGIRSTQVAHTASIDNNGNLVQLDEIVKMPISISDNSNQLFVQAIEISGTNYSDASGRVSVQSKHGSNYLFVSVYKNYIHLQGLHSRNATEYIRVFTDTLEFYKLKGFQPATQIIDNETSQLLENFLREKQIQFQYVPPDNHRANKAERAVQDAKNHLIAGLSTTHKDFPEYLWEDLLEQAEITLNLLRPFGPDPLISAYHGLFKKHYDFSYR